MMFVKQRILLAVSCLTFLVYTFMTFTVYASDTTIQPSQLQQWSNGPKVTVDSNSAGSPISITMNTQGLNKGLYTSYIFETKNTDWSEYGELLVSLCNESTEPLKFNIIVSTVDGTNLTVPDNRSVLIEHKEQEIVNLAKPDQGAIVVEGNFQGRIHIPFHSLQEKNEAAPQKEPGIFSISSWGMAVFNTEDREQKVRIDDLKLVSKDNCILENELAGMTVLGDQEVLKPFVGESIAQYSLDIRIQNKPVSYSLAATVEGAAITKDGRLTLTPGIQTDKLTLRVEIDNKWRKQFDVSLISSWTLNAKQQDGTSLAIPTSAEISKVMGSSDPFRSENTLILVRAIVLICGAAIGLLYWGMEKKAMK